MTCFPDVNVWIALSVEQHVHHRTANEWFVHEESEVALCRITQMGFLRLLTNPRVMSKDALSAKAAWRLLDSYMDHTRVTVAEEPSGLEGRWRELTREARGPQGWTDAYLAAFASESGFTLVTFDRGISRHKDFSVRLLRASRPSCRRVNHSPITRPKSARISNSNAPVEPAACVGTTTFTTSRDNRVTLGAPKPSSFHSQCWRIS